MQEIYILYFKISIYIFKTTLDKSKSYENKKLTDGKILNKLYNFGSCNSQSIVKDKFNDCGGRLIFNHKCENCFYI